MATKDFAASWVEVYNKSGGWSVKHRDHPIRTGGGSGTDWHTFIRIPDAVKTAINTSSTPASLHMRIYATTASNDVDIAHHKISSARGVGTSGLPWYKFNETWRGMRTGWNSYQMSGWFMPQFLAGNITGIVLYSNQGKFSTSSTGLGHTNHVRFRVTGTWNTAPAAPTNLRVDKSSADMSQVFRWDAAKDPDGDSLRYDVEYYNGSKWSRLTSLQSGTTYTHNIRNEPNTTSARYSVRAYDGELYGPWQNSGTFTVSHKPPTFSANNISYIDRNSTTVGITGNNQNIIQNHSLVRATTTAATGNDGKSISKYTFTLAGQTFSRTSVGTIDFSKINASTNQTLQVTAEDSQGLKTTVSKTVTMIPYSVPSIQYSANRIGSLADDVILKSNGSIASVDGKNTLGTTRYRYRSTTGSWSSWLNLGRTISGLNFTGTNVTLNLVNTQEWDIQVEVTDRISQNTINIRVGRGKPIAFFDEINDRMGIGKYPTRGALDVEGGAYFEGDLYVNDVNITNADRIAQYFDRAGVTPKDEISFWQNLPQGIYFVGPGNLPGQPTSWGVFYHSQQGGDWNSIWYTQPSGPIYRKSGNNNINFEWKQISNEIIGNKLWSGAVWLNLNHTVSPTKALSQCNNGWILEWSGYGSGTVYENSRTYTFIPKMQGNMPGNGGMYQIIGSIDGSIKSRYLYCKDTYFSGYADNSADGIVLRSVYEW